MLSNILCFVGNNFFPWLEIPISTLQTRLHIHRGLYWWSIKRKNIYRMRSRKEIAYVLDQVLVLCEWYLSLLPIMQRSMTPFLGSTSIVMFTWFQLIGTINFPQLLFNNVQFRREVTGWRHFNSSGKDLGHSLTLQGVGKGKVSLGWDRWIFSQWHPFPTSNPPSHPHRRQSLDTQNKDEVNLRSSGVASGKIIWILYVDVIPKVIWVDYSMVSYVNTVGKCLKMPW